MFSQHRFIRQKCVCNHDVSDHTGDARPDRVRPVPRLSVTSPSAETEERDQVTLRTVVDKEPEESKESNEQQSDQESESERIDRLFKSLISKDADEEDVPEEEEVRPQALVEKDASQDSQETNADQPSSHEEEQVIADSPVDTTEEAPAAAAEMGPEEDAGKDEVVEKERDSTTDTVSSSLQEEERTSAIPPSIDETSAMEVVETEETDTVREQLKRLKIRDRSRSMFVPPRQVISSQFGLKEVSKDFNLLLQVPKDLYEPSHPIKECDSPFASKLGDHVEQVVSQLGEGKKHFAHMARFLKKAGEVQQLYAKTMSDLVNTEMNEFDGIEDGMGSIASSWRTVLEQFKAASESNEAMGTGILNLFLPHVQQLVREHDGNLKAIEEEHRKCLEPIRSLRTEMDKVRSKALKVLEPIEKKKFKSKAKKKKVKVLQDAMEVVIRYEDTALEANNVVRHYHDVQLPAILAQYQAEEEKRFQVFENGLWVMDTLMTTVATQSAASAEAVRQGVSHVSSIGDFASFCDAAVKKERKTVVPFSLELPVSARFVKNMLREADTEEFRNTKLSDYMDDQCKLFPELTIPRLFVVLKCAVERLGGLQTEGIFRVSAQSAEVEDLEQQLALGDYDIRVTSPHVPAMLMKKWLRELTDPLIPMSFYDECIALAKSLSKKGYQELYDRIPEPNRSVIGGVLLLMKSISSPENCGASKMDLFNLGTVFAPSFLRRDEDDVMMSMQNSSFLINFVVGLAKYTDRLDYPQEEENGAGTYKIVSSKAGGGDISSKRQRMEEENKKVMEADRSRPKAQAPRFSVFKKNKE